MAIANGDRGVPVLTADGKRTLIGPASIVTATGERGIPILTADGKRVLVKCSAVAASGERGIPVRTADGYRTLVKLAAATVCSFFDDFSGDLSGWTDTDDWQIVSGEAAPSIDVKWVDVMWHDLPESCAPLTASCKIYWDYSDSRPGIILASANHQDWMQLHYAPIYDEIYLQKYVSGVYQTQVVSERYPSQGVTLQLSDDGAGTVSAGAGSYSVGSLETTGMDTLCCVGVMGSKSGSSYASVDDVSVAPTE